MAASEAGEAAAGERPAAYLRLLLALLLSAAFFDGYDGQVRALLLPNIQQTFEASTSALGIANIPVALGQFFSFFVIRMADRVGRRALLLWTVLGYTIFSTATALAPSLWAFAALQFGAQVFIGAEYGIAVTVVVEEFPAEGRGRAIGTLLTLGPVGAIVVGLLLAGGLQNTPLSWRAFYLVGLVPLALVAVARRRMQETSRFERERAERGAAPPAELLEPWLQPWRGRLVLVGLASLLQQVPASAAVAWWAYYAERERGYSTSTVALFVIVAYGLGTLGYYSCGRAMERFGRRRTGIVYTSASVAFGVALFQSASSTASFFLLILAVFFGLGIGPLYSAWATELFPTRIRAQASAWVRNWFAIAGQAGGPALVGILGDHYTGAIGSIGGTVSLLLLVSLPNLWLVWRYMPETSGLDLDVLAPKTTPDPVALRRLRRPFVLVLAAVALVLGGGGVAVRLLGSDQHRPSGAAELWLTAASGTTASTGRSAAEAQLDRFGSPDLAGRLIPSGVEGESAFTRIQVGQASIAGAGATVPFVVQVVHDRSPTAGALDLARGGSGWVVTGLANVRRVAPGHAPAMVTIRSPSGASLLRWVLLAAGGVGVLTAIVAATVDRARRTRPAPTGR